MNKPFVITEDEYNHDKMDFGKKEFIVYDNVCTPPVIFYTLDDKTMEGFIGKELLMKAREMVSDERMYVRNPEMEMDAELLRAEGDYNKHHEMYDKCRGELNMYYIVIGTYDGDVSYGVDSSSYIMGVFSEEKEAVKYMVELDENKSAFENEDGRFLIDGICGVESCSKEKAVKEDRELIRYCDFDYDILSFNGKPVYCGGANYLE